MKLKFDPSWFALFRVIHCGCFNGQFWTERGSSMPISKNQSLIRVCVHIIVIIVIIIIIRVTVHIIRK